MVVKGDYRFHSEDLDEAAMIDGASFSQVLWKVIVPLAKPGIAVTALLTWLFSWNEYLFAATLTSSRARTDHYWLGRICHRRWNQLG